MVVAVGGISIIYLIILFVLYILIHIGIGKLLGMTKKELEEKPGNLELEKQKLWLKRAFTWFPAAYVIIVLIILWL